MGVTSSILYAGAIFAMLCLLYLLRASWRSAEFVFVSFAVICLLEEMAMSINGQLPLSRMMQTWRSYHQPGAWVEIHSQWTSILYWRCALLVVAFLMLVAGAWQSSRSQSPAGDVAAV